MINRNLAYSSIICPCLELAQICETNLDNRKATDEYICNKYEFPLSIYREYNKKYDNLDCDIICAITDRYYKYLVVLEDIKSLKSDYLNELFRILHSSYYDKDAFLKIGILTDLINIQSGKYITPFVSLYSVFYCGLNFFKKLNNKVDGLEACYRKYININLSFLSPNRLLHSVLKEMKIRTINDLFYFGAKRLFPIFLGAGVDLMSFLDVVDGGLSESVADGIDRFYYEIYYDEKLEGYEEYSEDFLTFGKLKDANESVNKRFKKHLKDNGCKCFHDLMEDFDTLFSTFDFVYSSAVLSLLSNDNYNEINEWCINEDYYKIIINLIVNDEKCSVGYNEKLSIFYKKDKLKLLRTL